MTVAERRVTVGTRAAWLGVLIVLPIAVFAATDDFGTGPILGLSTAALGIAAGLIGRKVDRARSLLAAIFSLIAALLTGKGYVLATPFLVAALSFLGAMRAEIVGENLSRPGHP